MSLAFDGPFGVFGVRPETATMNRHASFPPLRVAAFEPRSRANGPGVRAVLWVQGCGRRCPGCFNAEFQPREGGRDVEVAECVRWIEAAEGIEGVTFSGGEPFDQAAALAEVACAVRTRGLGVLVFTGFPRGELERSADSGHRVLLAAADLLVAGPYEQDQPGVHAMLASANQELVFLTERYRGCDFGRRRVEYRIGADGVVRTSGFPKVRVGDPEIEA